MSQNIYIRTVRRWLWLIILVAVVAGSISYIINRSRPPLYQASTTIEVGSYLSSLNPNSSTISTSEQLAITYSEKIKTYPILKAVVDKLNLPMTTDSLASVFKVNHAVGTSLLAIVVTYVDPVVAADIANELANQLIAASPTNLTAEEQQQLGILQDEIQHAQSDLQAARTELTTVNAAISQRVGQDQAVLISRRDELTLQIGTLQSNLAQMLSTSATLQQEGSSNTLRIIEPSRVPEAPVSASVSSAVLVAAFVGAVAAAALGFVIDYLDNTLRSPSEVLPLLSVPLLGVIAPFGNKRTYTNKLLAWTQPRSPISESYRATRVNLLFREKDDSETPDCRVFVVTSAGPGEGKSVTTANLAITFANAGMRVLLVDADLHRPSIHRLFNLQNLTGVSSIWQKPKHSPIHEANALEAQLEPVEPANGIYLSKFTQRTEIPNLEIITAGRPLNNASEMLGTPQTRELIQQIIDSKKYDVVFFDTPPSLVVTDSAVIASLTRAKVIAVIEAGRTQRVSAKHLIDSLTDLGITIAGIVLNRLRPRDVDGGYGQYYYSYSRYTDGKSKK